MLYVFLFLFLVLFYLNGRRVGYGEYLKRVLVSVFDQSVHVVVFGGNEDETMSSAAWRLYLSNRYWYSKYPVIIINFFFNWIDAEKDEHGNIIKGHCQVSYENEMLGNGRHKSMR